MAQKMQATMTYMFGQVYGLGILPWQESEITGKMKSNPLVSEMVSTYMVSLCRRKVCVLHRSGLQKSDTDEPTGTGRGDCDQCACDHISRCIFDSVHGLSS